MASPTQDDFIRSLTLAVRPSTLRAPVLSYTQYHEPLPIKNPAQTSAAPAQHQPVTRAMALFMANLLLVGWGAVLQLSHTASLEEREQIALAALELGNAREERTAIASVPPDVASAMIAKMQPSGGSDLADNTVLPDVPHPRDTKGYAQIDRALSPGSALSMQERRKLLDAVRDTTLLAYEIQMANDLVATGAIAPRGSDAEPGQPRTQMVWQGDGAAGRRVNVNMDKPPLRGSL